jgi:hypothetical protein
MWSTWYYEILILSVITVVFVMKRNEVHIYQSVLLSQRYVRLSITNKNPYFMINEEITNIPACVLRAQFPFFVGKYRQSVLHFRWPLRSRRRSLCFWLPHSGHEQWSSFTRITQYWRRTWPHDLQETHALAVPFPRKMYIIFTSCKTIFNESKSIDSRDMVKSEYWAIVQNFDQWRVGTKSNKSGLIWNKRYLFHPMQWIGFRSPFWKSVPLFAITVGHQDTT